MTAPIGPGDLLLCVNNGPHPAILGAAPASLSVGSIYQVTRIGDDAEVGPLVWLYGVRESTHGGYCLWRFVPAGKRGDFSHFLTAKPLRVGEDA